MDKHSYIAVFDSGVGGISVLRELMALMPEEKYLYFGDSANAPYGTRTTEEVRVLTMNAAAMLYERGIKALVVACNTAPAAAINVLRQTYPDTIIIGIYFKRTATADEYAAVGFNTVAADRNIYITVSADSYITLLRRIDTVTISLNIYLTASTDSYITNGIDTVTIRVNS